MKIRILLADDHPVVRAGLRMVLEGEPDLEVVAEATDGDKAVQRAREVRPDVAVLDITMPVLSGLEAAAQIRGQNPACRVVILSMHHEPGFVREAFDAGADGYLTKDTDAGELPRAVRAVHAGQRYVCPEIAGVLVEAMLQPTQGTRGEPGGAPGLSYRQIEILRLMAEGHTSKQVGFALGLSSKTVDAHRRAIMKRIGAETVADLVRFAMRNGLLSNPSGPDRG